MRKGETEKEGRSEKGRRRRVREKIEKKEIVKVKKKLKQEISRHDLPNRINSSHPTKKAAKK